METLERSAEALRVLAHPHRLRMIELLSVRGLTVGAVADALGIPDAACSQHLNRMRAHGLVSSTREGKSVRYRTDDPRALAVIDCIRSHATTSRDR